jgi:membrane protein DedA with SNARE-associated domain
MPHTLDQILPSLEALGLWSYWIIGAAALLEAFFATGLFVPGMLVVAAGGILVQQGAIDYFDLAWFVAIGSILGGEASYWAGVLARKGIARRWNPEQSRQYVRARHLFERHGGLALVIGRFFGPLAGFVILAAALSGMGRRRFMVWNIASGIPYALIVPLAGYFLGDVFTRFGPLATRFALFAGGVLLALAVLWWLVADSDEAGRVFQG